MHPIMLASLYILFRRWVDPYFDPEVGCNDDQVLELAGNLAPTLLMDVMAVFAGLK